MLAQSSQLMKIIAEKESLIAKIMNEKHALEQQVDKLRRTEERKKTRLESQEKENEKMKNLVSQLRLLTQASKQKDSVRNFGQGIVTPRSVNKMGSGMGTE